MRVSILASEATPLSKTGGLGDVSAALPKALCRLGLDAILIVPYHRVPDHGVESGQVVHEPEATQVIKDLRIEWKGTQVSCSVWKSERTGSTAYLIDAPQFFKRPAIYGFEDDFERYAFFCRAALRALPLLGEPVDILHGNDWQCGFAIVELKLLNSDPFYSRTRSLQTIHNLAYQGIFKQDELAKLGLSSALNYFDWYGQASALKAGLMAADRLSTVSRRYAEEIQTKEFGCGLEGILSHRSSDLSGITNGIDQDVWNPKTDRHIKAHYSYEDLSGKSVCREDLLATYGLSTNQKPVVGSISRLVSQKGFDLIQEASDQIMATGISFVALGSGEPRFENFLEELRARYPDRVGIYRGYNEALAHKIEAGADIFLMPSQFEPCGLNQMYSMRYGTVPIVRKTGGLDDTVTGYDSRREGSTGFKFEKYTSDALLASFREAVECYGNRGIWRNLQINGMKMDNSWEAAAGKYIEIYQRLAKI